MNKDTMFTQACTSHILVSDEGAANQILTQLRNGGDFKALAAANSTDTSNKDQGGELGCLGKGQLVPEYEDAVAKAKDGDLIGPVKTDFGYHIIFVESTYAPQPLDKVRDQIVQTFSDPQGQGWAQYTLATANIKVDPRYGKWNHSTYDIDLPEGAQTNTPNVLNPS
jgi:parvulin-like peptidyl-prolyl isomerase